MDTTDYTEAAHLEVLDAAAAAKEALETLREALNADPAVYDGLRYGGAVEGLGRAPYALRNLLPDLEGSEGGWLISSEDGFMNTLTALERWVDGNIDECPGCGGFIGDPDEAPEGADVGHDEGCPAE